MRGCRLLSSISSQSVSSQSCPGPSKSVPDQSVPVSQSSSVKENQVSQYNRPVFRCQRHELAWMPFTIIHALVPTSSKMSEFGQGESAQSTTDQCSESITELAWIPFTCIHALVPVQGQPDVTFGPGESTVYKRPVFRESITVLAWMPFTIIHALVTASSQMSSSVKENQQSTTDQCSESITELAWMPFTTSSMLSIPLQAVRCQVPVKENQTVYNRPVFRSQHN